MDVHFMTLRQRFAEWLCAPLKRRVQSLEMCVAENRQEIRNLKQFCEQLSADMAKQAELRSVMETQPQQRVRVVNGSRFVAAAELATKGIKART